jgi:hypothetical protein
MDFIVTKTRTQDYIEQLEPSTFKDECKDLLLECERRAKYWNDYCTHKSLYSDFQQYMAIHYVESEVESNDESVRRYYFDGGFIEVAEKDGDEYR